MTHRPKLYAWIAALGVLLHVGTATASTWCKVMGLVPSCCCPADLIEEAEWNAPSDCCKPALEAPQFGEGEASFSHVPVLAVLPWEESIPDHVVAGVEAGLPDATATSPPLLALSTIVMVC